MFLKIAGSAQFFFSKDVLAGLYEPGDGDGDVALNVTASVTEASTGGWAVEAFLCVMCYHPSVGCNYLWFPRVHREAHGAGGRAARRIPTAIPQFPTRAEAIFKLLCQGGDV